MTTMTSTGAGWFRASDCDIAELAALTEQPVTLDQYRHAASIEQGTVVYEAATLRDATSSTDGRRIVMAELAEVLLSGPGVVVISGAFSTEVVGQASKAFNEIIDDERRNHIGGGDHFAKPGANDRVWNALEKLALHDPQVFADYYDNDIVALISTAWLGPGYQVTSQVNVVNPGGEAQSPHRDYHLGFMTDEQAERFPAHVHQLSPVLTLQGAVAHCEMPVETGPTMYLPHSQKFGPGYVAWRRPDVKQFFDEHHVQLALQTGDAVFFNPALFHAAGTNRTTDVKRMANLLQVSSAFGRAMEAVDRRAMVTALYPVLLGKLQAGSDLEPVLRVVAASAEGYAFPGDLDRDQPVDGLAHDSDAAVVARALEQRLSAAELAAQLFVG